MARDYATVSPVLQFDQMACWAASMEWWLRYMGGSRPQLSQYDIISIQAVKDATFYPPDNDAGNANQDFGGLTKDGMKALFDHPPFRMQYKQYGAGSLRLSSLEKRLKKSPIVIIYYNSSVQGYHANVVVKAEEILWGMATSIKVMEPQNPSFEPQFLSWFTARELYIGWAD